MKDDSERDANVRAGVIVTLGLGLEALGTMFPAARYAATLLPALERGLALTQRHWPPHRLQRIGATLAASGLLDGDVELDVAVVEDEGTFAAQVLEAAVDDDDKKKSWAYGALFRAFHDGVVAVDDRPKWVSLIRQLFHADLVRLVNGAQVVETCKSYHRGDAATDRLRMMLAENGFAEDAEVVGHEINGQTASAMSVHLAARFREFGWVDGDGRFTVEFERKLYPALLAAGKRAKLVAAPMPESDFFALILAKRHERTPRARGQTS